jgi:hypothetical protein
MTRSTAIPLAGGVLLAGALAAGVLFGPLGSQQQQLGLDGGAVQPTAPGTLPDGGPWAIANDSGQIIVLGVAPSVIGQVDVATPTGYMRVSYTALPDGGYQLGSTALPFTCGCAIDATCIWVADGGPVPPTGSYAASLMSGNCGTRPCTELSGFSGAAAGCNP